MGDVTYARSDERCDYDNDERSGERYDMGDVTMMRGMTW